MTVTYLSSDTVTGCSYTTLPDSTRLSTGSGSPCGQLTTFNVKCVNLISPPAWRPDLAPPLN